MTARLVSQSKFSKIKEILPSLEMCMVRKNIRSSVVESVLNLGNYCYTERHLIF